MAITIYKYSRKELETQGFDDDNISSLTNNYFICIDATGGIHGIPHFKENHTNVLNIQFDDTEIDKWKSCPSLVEGGPDVAYFAKACTEDDAIKLKKFIDKIPNDATVHISCTKGKSRSAAVSNFIAEYKNNENKLFDQYNEFVYNLLIKVKDA
jgi:predicted protein tyrosine phosphatase